MKKRFSLLLLAAAVLGACTTASKYQTTVQKDIDALTKSASFEMPKVPVPSFPDRTFNVLEPVSAAMEPRIRDALEFLRSHGAFCARMSGSGSACFGVFPEDAPLEAYRDELRIMKTGVHITAERMEIRESTRDVIFKQT